MSDRERSRSTPGGGLNPASSPTRALVLATVSFALSFAAWGLVGGLASIFTALYSLTASQTALLVAVPVLLVAGEHDTNAPPKVMARMAEAITDARARVRYVCLDGAGHLMNLTHAAAFDAEVRAFLATL